MTSKRVKSLSMTRSLEVRIELRGYCISTIVCPKKASQKNYYN